METETHSEDPAKNTALPDERKGKKSVSGESYIGFSATAGQIKV